MENLKEEFEKEQIHKNNCSVCGQEFDMRDLSQVFAHEPCDGKHKDYNAIEKIERSEGKRVVKTRFQN